MIKSKKRSVQEKTSKVLGPDAAGQGWASQPASQLISDIVHHVSVVTGKRNCLDMGTGVRAIMSERRSLTPEREEQPAPAAKHQFDEERITVEMSSDTASLLRDIAEDIPNNEAIEALGKKLGFSMREIRNFIRTKSRYHKTTNDGTFSMLREWSRKVMPSSVRPYLRQALMRAKLGQIAEKHLPSGNVSEGKPKDLTKDEVLQVKKELRRFYQSKYSNARISPHLGSSMSLDDIHPNLAMFSEGMAGNKTNMNYDDFIEHLEDICANRESNNRIALFGEAGIGKTTFLAKLTLDWASGRCLEAIDLLFLIPFREIEENTLFGDNIMGKISNEVKFDATRVEKHIRKNPRKVLILFDGLDEYGKDISDKLSNNDTIAVIRGERFKTSPVVVTTRPWRAKEITSNKEVEKRYRFVEVGGFNEKDVISCISKFFPNNKEARDGLIGLMTNEDSLVAQNMKPYPIYCSMLCYIWQDKSSRSVIQGLETFAQLFEELIHHLKVQYAGKEKIKKKQAEKLKQGEDCLQQFSKDALYCLLKNNLVFRKDDLETSEDALKTVCEVGVLTREKWFVCRRENNRRRTETVVEYRIPHKLFMEFLAGSHLALLYESNREEFNRIKSEVIADYRSFEYLLYFTVAQNKEVGKAVIGSLCPMYGGCLTQYHFLDFLVNVAFECHKKEVLEPIIPLLEQMSSLQITRGHTGRGWIFVYKTCRHFASNHSDDSGETSMDESVQSVSLAAGRGINFPSNLTSLEMENAMLDDDFFTAMFFFAPQSQLESIRHIGGPGISASASEAYAKSICTMPNLKNLRLNNVAMADTFFATLAASASGARVERMELCEASMSASILYSISRLPCLKSLSVQRVKNQLPTSHRGNNREESENKGSFVKSTMDHLGVDTESLPLLWHLDVTSLFPDVNKVSVHGNIDQPFSFLDLDKVWPLYSHDVELNLQGYMQQIVWDFKLRHCLLAPPTVIRLSVTDVSLCNEEAMELIKSASSYPHLKNVLLIRCGTSEGLDPFCAEINAVGRLLVTVRHGEPSIRQSYTKRENEMSRLGFIKARAGEQFLVNPKGGSVTVTQSIDEKVIKKEPSRLRLATGPGVSGQESEADPCSSLLHFNQSSAQVMTSPTFKSCGDRGAVKQQKLANTPVGLNDRLMSMHLPLGKKRSATIISAYAPTMTNPDEVKDKFYEELDSLIASTKSEKLIILGDLNARVEADHHAWHNVLGKHGIGNCNSYGHLLLRFCSSHDLVITNTMFRLPTRNKTSWMHPRSKHCHLIDYMIVRARDRQDVRVTEAMCGADCWTDHRLIISKMNLLIQPKRRPQGQKNDPSSMAKKAAFTNARSKIQAKLRHIKDSWLSAKADEIQSFADRYDMKNSYDVPINHKLDVPPSEKEVDIAITQLSCGRAPGSDSIPAEVYKKDGPITLIKLTKLYQSMWNKEQLPKEFRDATVVHIYKRKGNRQACDNHRGISLLSIAGNILARVLLNRLLEHLESHP
ncbi:uncharacterized protein [Diadema setosum]|uniref:uncharacterized protein n=1 Tax=Diadema setosum TaxID=31175 RepID=UPI003B3A2D10